MQMFTAAAIAEHGCYDSLHKALTKEKKEMKLMKLKYGTCKEFG